MILCQAPNGPFRQNHPDTFFSENHPDTFFWMGCGVVLALAMAAFSASLRAASATDSAASMFVRGGWMYVIACGAYGLGAWIGPVRGGRGRLAFVLLVAVLIRLSVWRSPEVGGSDYDRYLWDGAMTAAGENPYAAAPGDVLRHPDDLPPRLAELAKRGQAVLERVNHPELRTLYPPAAQALFAVAHWVAPFDLLGWRLVLLLTDLAGALIVGLAAKHLHGAPVTRALMVYAWNPLLVTETYFGGHLDLAPAVLVLIALSAAARAWTGVGAGILAVAAGVKLWPAMLIGLLLRPAGAERARLIRGGVVFCLISAMLAAAYAQAFGRGNSGIGYYAAGWNANGGAFALLDGVIQSLDLSRRAADGAVRGTLAALVIGFAVSMVRRPIISSEDLFARAGMLTLFMLLLSPTLHPWYAVALIPLAAVRPHPSLLAWTILLPLVYLPAEGLTASVIIPLAVHGPVWLLLLRDLRRRSAGAISAGVPAHA